MFYIILIMRTSGGRPARAGYCGKRPRINQITAERFRDMRQTCLLTVAATAKVLRVTERTIHHWESGQTRIPFAAYKLVRILWGYALPGNGWDGWQLIGENLYSPEGHAFRSTDSNWWSLLVARAKVGTQALRTLTRGREAREIERQAWRSQLASMAGQIPAGARARTVTSESGRFWPGSDPPLPPITFPNRHCPASHTVVSRPL